MDFLRTHKYTLGIGLVLLALVLIEAHTIGDFEIFLQASQDLLKGENIYQIKYHEWYHYYYDAFFALLIYPLTYLPVYWATVIWLGLNVLLTLRIWQSIKFQLPLETFSPKALKVFTILTCAIAFSLWHRNIHLGQMTIFLLYLCLEGMHRIDQEEPLKGGFLLAMGISVKIMPLVLVPYLVYRHYFKGALSALVFTGLILIVPAAVIGLEQNTILLEERWALVNPMNSEHVMDVDETTFHSITTFLSVLLVKDAGAAYRTDLPRNIANVSKHTLSLVINIVRLLLVLGTLYIIRSLPFQRPTDRLQKFYEMSYIYLIIPLIFPHQQHYGFFFALPAIAYLVYHYTNAYTVRAFENWRSHRFRIIFLAVLVFFLLNSHFLLGEFRNFYDHYKTLTYGMLFLVVLLATHRPQVTGSITTSAITDKG
ncbi:MAG: DUF2029 domain-containing protein [Flavobacteriales bacterium]|nr:DUF2029 domain-containing protein [Flavobacteriales bacterium]MBK6945529.1 DUF2029 domain-containing protein [Flavobacteriales bacterium]MBK7241645.1 DUF2029 domain-containing protein [Flavobacteriales bacterium]MBK7296363.1 DUF2029 domain-containing protein [Flavobacteriales bacterium]MBK9534915.1 DUF2029 domain-containing protein [Flavobacteriales bacterium]